MQQPQGTYCCPKLTTLLSLLHNSLQPLNHAGGQILELDLLQVIHQAIRGQAHIAAGLLTAHPVINHQTGHNTRKGCAAGDELKRLIDAL